MYVCVCVCVCVCVFMSLVLPQAARVRCTVGEISDALEKVRTSQAFLGVSLNLFQNR